MKTSIFWADIEFTNLDNSMNAKGGFVYAFVTTSDIETAKELFRSALFKLGKTINKYKTVDKYISNTKWDTAELDKHYKALVNSTKQTGEVIFDTFYEYKH